MSKAEELLQGFTPAERESIIKAIQEQEKEKEQKAKKYPMDEKTYEISDQDIKNWLANKL